MFADHATVFDYQERQRLLADLVSLCTSSGSVDVAGEVHATSTSLQIYFEYSPKLSIQRGTVTYSESPP